MERNEDKSGYTRRLRRYEAAPVAQQQISVSTGGSMELFSPFGPFVSRLRVPENLVLSLNRYADDFVARSQSSGTDGSALGEFSIPESVASQGGADSLASCTARWIRSYLNAADNREVKKVRFDMFWMVRQFANSFSPVHFHSGDISGVMYLKVPEQIANEAEEISKTYISARRAGYITFIIGGKQQFSKSLISFKPEVGDFYIFPGWLLHAVEPFGGDGERRSLAFNAFVS